MDPRLHKHSSSKSSSSSSSNAAEPELNYMLFMNAKNVFRVARTKWTGHVRHRFNVETMEDEYWLKLDFVNFEGWCTEAFVNDELIKFEVKKSETVNK